MLSEGRLERVGRYADVPMVYTKGFWQSGEANRLMFGEIRRRCAGPAVARHGRCRGAVEPHGAARRTAPFSRRAGDAGQARRPPPVARRGHRVADRGGRGSDARLMIFLLLATQAAIGPTGPAASPESRYEHCLDRATADPKAAEAEAGQWQLAGGGFFAQQCLGMAYANEQRWAAAAAGAFDAAARAAEKAGDARSANYWAQAGNAWLAAGDASKARGALDAALSAGTLKGLPLGEAHLDRARAMVAGDDMGECARRSRPCPGRSAGRSTGVAALGDARAADAAGARAPRRTSPKHWRWAATIRPCSSRPATSPRRPATRVARRRHGDKR